MYERVAPSPLTISCIEVPTRMHEGSCKCGYMCERSAALTPHDLLHRRPDPDARVHDPLVAEEGREGRVLGRQGDRARHLEGREGGDARVEELLDFECDRAKL